jgi:hypothetical protein
MMPGGRAAMSPKRTEFDDLLGALERVRDQVELKIHLASADARDEWEELEKKWRRLRGKLGSIGRAAEDTAEDVGEALELLGKELKRGYERLRKAL